MAETATNIIKGAYRLLKVIDANEPLGAVKLADGLVYLNDLIEEWSLEPFMQTGKQQLSQTLTPSTGSYTFGTGGDNSTRPVMITKAFVRDTNGNDFYLEITDNSTYNEILDKDLSTNYPCYLYYRAAYPLGVVNLYPVPSAAYTLYIEHSGMISSVASGATIVDLAPAYIAALKPNLAVKMAPWHKLHDSFPLVQQQAKESLARIKRINSKDRPARVSPIREYFHGRNSLVRSLFP